MRKRTSISPNDLDRLKRSELQALCRKHNVKGLTRKNAELISDLRAAFLEKQKDEISDVELSDSEYPASGAEDSEDKDKSDLLDELTFAPSTFTKKVLSNISYTKEVPSTRVKQETHRTGKPKKASEYTKMIESDEESDSETTRSSSKAVASNDTDMNDSFVFTFDNSAAKKLSKTSRPEVSHEAKKYTITSEFTKSTKHIVKPAEPTYSKAKEPPKALDSYDSDTKAKTYTSQEPVESSGSIADPNTTLPKHKPSRPRRLVRHTVAAKPFEIKVPKAIQNEKVQDLKTKPDTDILSSHAKTLPSDKNEELEVKPEPKPIAQKKRPREYESSIGADIDVLEEKPKVRSTENVPQIPMVAPQKAETRSVVEPPAKRIPHVVKAESPKSTFHDPFAGESVSEWLERINLPSAVRTFERENMMDWKLVQLLTFEYLGVMGFTVGDALKLLLALKDKFPKEVLIQSNPLSHSQISLIQQIVDEKIQAALDSYSQSTVKSKPIPTGPSLQSKPTGSLQQTLHSQPQTSTQHQAQPQTRPKVSATIANALSSNVSAGLSSSSSPLSLSISANADDRRDSIPKGNTIQKRTLWEKSISQPKESTATTKVSKPILNKSTTVRQPVVKRAVGNRAIRANSIDLQTMESPAKKRRLDNKPSEVPAQASSVLSAWHDEAVIDPLANSELPRQPTGDNPFRTKFTLPRTPPKSTPNEENEKEEPQAPGTGGRKRWADIPPLETNWQPKYVP